MSTIKQRIKGVVIQQANGERTIEVRRLLWKPAKEFVRLLAKSVAELFAVNAAKAGAEPEPFVARLASCIVGSEELITLLLTKSTSLTADEIDNLDFGDVLALVDAAIEINLDAETKNSSAGIVAKVRAFIAPATTS